MFFQQEEKPAVEAVFVLCVDVHRTSEPGGMAFKDSTVKSPLLWWCNEIALDQDISSTKYRERFSPRVMRLQRSRMLQVISSVRRSLSLLLVGYYTGFTIAYDCFLM